MSGQFLRPNRCYDDSIPVVSQGVLRSYCDLGMNEHVENKMKDNIMRMIHHLSLKPLHIRVVRLKPAWRSSNSSFLENQLSRDFLPLVIRSCGVTGAQKSRVEWFSSKYKRGNFWSLNKIARCWRGRSHMWLLRCSFYEFCVECSSKTVKTVRARTTENISELIEITHSFCSHKILLSFVESTIHWNRRNQ